MGDDKRRQSQECVHVFKNGDKQVAEELLPRIAQPAAVTTV